jgi:hypothetical protein
MQNEFIKESRVQSTIMVYTCRLGLGFNSDTIVLGCWTWKILHPRNVVGFQILATRNINLEVDTKVTKSMVDLHIHPPLMCLFTGLCSSKKTSGLSCNGFVLMARSNKIVKYYQTMWYGKVKQNHERLQIYNTISRWFESKTNLSKKVMCRINISLQSSHTNWFPFEAKIISQIRHGFKVSSFHAKSTKCIENVTYGGEAHIFG